MLKLRSRSHHEGHESTIKGDNLDVHSLFF
jgi:hypothetical protein